MDKWIKDYIIKCVTETRQLKDKWNYIIPQNENKGDRT